MGLFHTSLAFHAPRTRKIFNLQVERQEPRSIDKMREPGGQKQSQDGARCRNKAMFIWSRGPTKRGSHAFAVITYTCMYIYIYDSVYVIHIEWGFDD